MSRVHLAWTDGDAIREEGAADAVFPWWSFTKTVIAVTCLRLARRGVLDLDAALPGRAFSARQLLRNEAGVPDYGPLKAYHAAVAAGEPAWTEARLLREVRADQSDFAPGTGWRYSNTGYLLLRRHLEAVTGESLAALIRAEVTGPLGLEGVRLAEAPGDLAGIHWAAGRDYDPRWVYHRTLLGTAAEAARLLHGVFRGGLLEAEELAALTDRLPLGGPIPGRPWVETGYALGLMCGPAEGGLWLAGHSGGGPFSANAVYHVPEAGLTAAAFVEGSDEAPAEWAVVRLVAAQRA